MSAYTEHATVPASLSDGQLTDVGVVVPHVVVAVSTDPAPHVVMSTLGPDGDVPEARMTGDDVRELAAALVAAADALEGPVLAEA